jgi:DNA-binding transcriptional ArsR family regulator
MEDDPDLSRIANLMADRTRARMLWMLIDGTSRPAGELAFGANVSAQSASGHLAKLVAGGLLKADAQGRHRYFRISGPEVAAVIEGLASLSAVAPPRSPRAPLPTPATPVAFLQARTCYGHLAGEMAVKLLEAMLASRWLTADGRDYSVTQTGHKRLLSLGIDSVSLKQPRRVYARACVDLTQRRAHLGGMLGEALLNAFQVKGWVLRHRNSRVVTITPKGCQGIQRALGPLA